MPGCKYERIFQCMFSKCWILCHVLFLAEDRWNLCDSGGVGGGDCGGGEVCVCQCSQTRYLRKGNLEDFHNCHTDWLIISKMIRIALVEIKSLLKPCKQYFKEGNFNECHEWQFVHHSWQKQQHRSEWGQRSFLVTLCKTSNRDNISRRKNPIMVIFDFWVSHIS